MEIKRSGSQPSAKGPVEFFTGDVRIDPLFEAPAPARTLGATVTFEPGARTAWHTHPLGQITPRPKGGRSRSFAAGPPLRPQR
jgi:quercetin dioxygenase-like cupin family protein